MANTHSRDIEALKSKLLEQGVKYAMPIYVDVHGVPKSKTVPIEHLERVVQGSELFTGAALDGLGQGPHDDELAVYPDREALCVLPWRPEIAWLPGNLKYHDEPWSMCSRTVLCDQITRAEKLGLKFMLGMECEIYVVRKDGAQIEPANPNDRLEKAAYDVLLTLEGLPWLDEMVGHMNALGWHVHSFDHEDSNSQFEFDFAYADCLTMADRFVLWRVMAKEIARRHGIEAALMPKPYSNRTGSGAHFNMSLVSAQTGQSVMGDPADRRGCGLSKTGYQFIAGVLRHAAAVCAVTCPTVNSYKRLVKTGSMTGYTWAPIYISYGGNNRTHMLRVPWVRPEIERTELGEGEMQLGLARVESRAVDTTVNPYLGAAMMLGAGIEGIEQQLDPGEPIAVNMYELSEEELKASGVKTLPRTLLEAIEAFDRDPLSRRVLGNDLAESYVELKSREWWDYHNTVTPWEIETYFTRF